MNIGKLQVVATSEYCGVFVRTDRVKAIAEANFIDPDWWISRILVNPLGVRGKGIGGKLLTRLKKLIKKEGGTDILVTPGGYGGDVKRQRRFYRKYGFRSSRDGSGIMAIEL